MTVAPNGSTGGPEEPKSVCGLTGDLSIRVVSSLIIAPAAIFFILVGGPYLACLIAVVGGRAMWEWARLVTRERSSLLGVLTSLVVVACVLLAAIGWSMVSLGVLAVGVLVSVGASIARRLVRGTWLAMGLVVVTVPCISFLHLRAVDDWGLATSLWLVLTVVASDVGAYAAGRSIGGPKIAPAISPKKTWSGCCGGLLLSVVLGWATAHVLALPTVWPVLIFAAAFSVVAQIGDLTESALKRRFEVKDSGALIPGHGGLLDRLDGHFAVIPVAAVLTLAAGHSLLVFG